MLRLLDKNDQNGMGGLLRDDVEESLPNAARVLKVNYLCVLLVVCTRLILDGVYMVLGVMTMTRFEPNSWPGWLYGNVENYL